VSDIVGAKAYHDGKVDHVRGIRVDGDRLIITLARRAPDFPARISAGYFTAVPLGTPIYRHGVERPIPSAGPYYISSHIGGTQLVLRRNPNYRGPRPQHLDGIVMAANVSEETGAARVERGNTDYVFSDRIPLPAVFAPGGRLDRRFGAAAGEGEQRYFKSHVSAIGWLVFNTGRGIFRDARLRRAANFAIDRPALAASSYGIPWASMLPPGIPGAGGDPAYPLDGPDLAKARPLAGGRGGSAVLLHQSERYGCSFCAEVAAVVKANLAAIGIDVRTRGVDDPRAEAGKPGVRVDLVLDGWFGDWADPSNFVNNLLDGERPLGYGYEPSYFFYDDVRYIARMRAAHRLRGDERTAAYRDLVAEMMCESPPGAVYLTSALPAHFFSDRVDPKCVVSRPQDGGFIDLTALCLRD
jgi:peptide/nickel transport system substrate-binding protein